MPRALRAATSASCSDCISAKGGTLSDWKYQPASRSPKEPMDSIRFAGSTIFISSPGRCIRIDRMRPTSLSTPQTAPHVARNSASSSKADGPAANMRTVWV